MNTTNNNLQSYTLLPIREEALIASVESVIYVNTPHKDVEMISTHKDVPTGFLGFGSGRRDKKTHHEIVSEIKQLEYEASKFLLENWANKSKLE